ncbi:hypothetical protein N657DRAFT_684989 [Parathielavia appendiculata]|uniref:N-acetyltransferase domain-containing protein n=1 Tax=Parathielavia appendiculata TaxID=2587402 RepID=A0AAN6YYZ8_9PEZI|nr:hypothetical protein N657DRAFT_684989 [Parathielavia appendiculata]
MVPVRPALPGDLDAIAAIHTYYVLNTHHSTYQHIVSDGLPYLVAVDDDDDSSDRSLPATVLGYANAHDFRGGVESAYRHTVEISLFCHPDHRSKGVGSLLLEKLVSALRNPARHPVLHLPDARGKERKVKEVMAVMAVDDLGEGGGLKV